MLNDLKEVYDEIHFFGDKTEYGGNDYPIALVIRLSECGTVNQVADWKHTWNLLKEFT